MKNLEKMILFSESIGTGLQPKGQKSSKNQTYRLRQPTKSMYPALRKLIKEVDEEIKARKSAESHAISLAEQPSRMEKRAKEAKEKEEKELAAQKERTKVNLAGQQRTLHQTMAWLALPRSITRATSVGSVGNFESPSCTLPQSLSRQVNNLAAVTSGQNGTIELKDDNPLEEDEDSWDEQRLSMLGSKNTNDAALEDKWTTNEWEILIDGLMQDEGQMEPSHML